MEAHARAPRSAWLSRQRTLPGGQIGTSVFNNEKALQTHAPYQCHGTNTNFQQTRNRTLVPSPVAGVERETPVRESWCLPCASLSTTKPPRSNKRKRDTEKQERARGRERERAREREIEKKIDSKQREKEKERKSKRKRKIKRKRKRKPKTERDEETQRKRERKLQSVVGTILMTTARIGAMLTEVFSRIIMLTLQSKYGTQD